jgi:hypothetical protein
MSKIINIESLVSLPLVNCVEIYVCADKSAKEEDANRDMGSGVLSLVANHQPITAFGAGYETTLTNYYYKDMCYTYDMTNDGQRVTTRTFVKDEKHRSGIYVLCLNEETLPSHRFPCVQDMSNKTSIQRRSYRINNRVYLNHDVVYEDDSITDSLYFKYNHAPQVDLKQIQNDIDRALCVLLKKS